MYTKNKLLYTVIFCKRVQLVFTRTRNISFILSFTNKSILESFFVKLDWEEKI